MAKAKIAIYPGSFDPVTYGHIDIIKRAVGIFDKIIIAVGENSQKKYLFSLKERTMMLKEAVKGIGSVSIEHFSGLMIDFAEKKGAAAIIRGLRAVSDFEHEFQLALTNRRLNPKIETIFIMTRGKYCYLNSGIVKEIASLKGKVSDFVPKNVEKILKEKFNA